MTYELSPHQERLWFIDRFETGNVYPESPTYHNIPLLLHGSGSLDAIRVAAALRTLAARHGALRTRIETGPDGPVQSVGGAVDIAVPTLDLGAKTDLAQAVEVAVAEAQRPIALETDPLLRAVLLRFGTGGFLLVVTLHHLIADKASLRTLAAEFGEIMCSAAEGRAPALREPSLQYADYAVWQRGLSDAASEPLLFYGNGSFAADWPRSNCPRPALGLACIPSRRRDTPLLGRRPWGPQCATSPPARVASRKR